MIERRKIAICWEGSFAAAHHLPLSESLVTKKCNNLHGHNYKVKAFLSGFVNDDGFLVDYKKIKEKVDYLDHKNLNDIFTDFPPTTENIAIWLADELYKLSRYIRYVKVEVQESEHTKAIAERVEYVAS